MPSTRFALLETPIAAAIDRVRARVRTRAVLLGIAAGGASASLMTAIALAFTAPPSAATLVAVVAGLTVAAWATRTGWSVTAVTAAAMIERAWPLDNLVVTAVELAERPRPVRTGLRDEILKQAAARLAEVDVARLVSMRQPLAVALAVIAGSAALMTRGAGTASVPVPALGTAVRASTRGIDIVTVHVTPPAYSGRPPAVVEAPLQITVVAGSRIRLAVTSAAEGVAAEIAGRPLLTLAREGAAFTGEWQADHSTAVAIRPAGGQDGDAKFLSVVVVPDAPPVVRIPVPGKDLAIAGTTGRITIDVDAQDDLGLAELSLRFTKVSGGGESFAFTEAEVPLAIGRDDQRRWRGRAEWVLDGLDLSAGDVLVYRAIARDRNPDGKPAQSEPYLVEVGRLAGAVGSGFALPAEEKKYAISQQMVIYKTEQLIASAKGQGLPSRSLGEGWIEQNQLLAIEQRMVRAEVVFLGGGEVQDEVEEAAHSDEVTEGRLENSGRAEMLRAINFMSQAEAQLNAGKAREALVLEREALRSLERAFDRRRYFLRTLPDRSRIDVSRRLTGNLKDARSWTRQRYETGASPGVEAQRALMRALAGAASTGAGVDAALAARVAALDLADPSLQQAAVTLASASDDQHRRDAVWAAMQAVTAHALNSLAPRDAFQFTFDPLAGRLADEMSPARRPRR